MPKEGELRLDWPSPGLDWRRRPKEKYLILLAGHDVLEGWSRKFGEVGVRASAEERKRQRAKWEDRQARNKRALSRAW